MIIRRIMVDNSNTPKDIPLSVDTDENGKITGWEMALTHSQAVDMLGKVLYKATVRGDMRTAEIAKTILGHLRKNSKTDSNNTSEKK